jgi:hypothetical protein
LAVDTDRIDDCVLALLLLGRHDGQRVRKTNEAGARPISDETIRMLSTAESFARGEATLPMELFPICIDAATD